MLFKKAIEYEKLKVKFWTSNEEYLQERDKNCLENASLLAQIYNYRDKPCQNATTSNIPKCSEGWLGEPNLNF